MRYITRKRRKRQGLGLVSETFEALGKGRELVAVHRQTEPPHPPSWGVIERPRIVGPAPAPPHTPTNYAVRTRYRQQFGYTACRLGWPTTSSSPAGVAGWEGKCVPILKSGEPWWRGKKWELSWKVATNEDTTKKGKWLSPHPQEGLERERGSVKWRKESKFKMWMDCKNRTRLVQ